MATYIIGDIQGCYQELQELLNYINFNPKQDRLGFTGDLVNRGPESLKCLRFIKKLTDPIIVLGNHDLYLLTLGYGAIKPLKATTMEDVFAAADKLELLDWLRQQPLIHYDKKHKYLLVHAGIPPQWSVEKALALAHEVETILRSNQFIDFLKNLFGNEPTEWKDELSSHDRLRYIVNALTRMRFCTKNGKLDLTNKTNFHHNPSLYQPWFKWINPLCDIFFGHWAALEGICEKPRCYAVDTGCVWGGGLTAIRIEDKKLFTVPCARSELGHA